MSQSITRRRFLQATVGSTVSWLGSATQAALAGTDAKLGNDTAFGPRTAFSFDALIARASQEAAKAYGSRPLVAADSLDKIDYDSYQHIRFRPSATLALAPAGALPAQLFHMGQSFKEPVKIHLVDGDAAREVVYSNELFELPADHPARALPPGLGFAGFRVMGHDLKTDWLSFLGASYFRSSGPFNQYGLSARGLAIDTGLSTPEEFPRFTEFYLAQSSPLTVFALLDSPRVTGAYRISAVRSTDSRNVNKIVMEIDAHLFARADIGRLGIAPFSSMFWYGEAGRRTATDWRPEIHDSDGLSILTGKGERIWRPLNNPPAVKTNTFADTDPKGFGLEQRDRDFVHYLDDGVFYERRASVWVEPLDAWGPGAVHLLEIPTDDEIHDNIAAYWCPDGIFKKGEQRRYRYRLSWLDAVSMPDGLGRVSGTWTGAGGRPGHKRPEGVRKFAIDFQGKAFGRLGRDDGVEIVVKPSRGTIQRAYTHPVVDQRERWRAIFDLEAAGNDPVDLRAFLRHNGRPLTETWIYQYFPEA